LAKFNLKSPGSATGQFCPTGSYLLVFGGFVRAVIVQ